jgi:tetratricopeptide (TPR) repeat protein
LEELRNELPNYPVDRLIGHISYSQQRYASAIEAYSKVAVSDLTRMDFIEYARALQLARKFDESQRIVQAGLSKEPLNATLNRFALMNCNDLKKFDESLKYAEVLFTKVDKDSVNLSDLDYMNYAKAFYGNNQFEEAIAKYKEALAQPAEDKSMHADLYKGISDSYKGMKDYPNAIESYQSFLNAKADADATDHAGLGLLQNSYARSLEGDARVEAFDKADQMWADMIAKFPDAEEYALLQRGNLKAQMDTELKGTAKAIFERLIELIKAHETIDDTDKGRLFNAYSYLMRYNVKQKNSAAALSNAESLLELQPEDAEIKKVVETLRKAAK